MPTNSDYDGFFSGIDGVPMFTYGMIASTIVVLSYMTFMEESLPEEIEPDSSVLSAAITSPIPPASLTEEGGEPIPFIPQEEPAANELVPEQNEQPPSSLQEEVINDEDSPPPSEPKQSIGGKNKKRRITKRRKPQA